MTDQRLLDHFESLHATSPDPWSVESSWFEIRKRQLAMSMLTEPHYRRAFEPACSIGALTELLAPRCHRLLATDSSPSAVAACRRRLAGVDGVEIAQSDMTTHWPHGRFDLVVLSEVGYYLGPVALASVMRNVVGSLNGSGSLLAMHWRSVASDFVQAGGDEVHEHIRATDGVRTVSSYVDEDVRIDVYAATR